MCMSQAQLSSIQPSAQARLSGPKIHLEAIASKARQQRAKLTRDCEPVLHGQHVDVTQMHEMTKLRAACSELSACLILLFGGAALTLTPTSARREARCMPKVRPIARLCCRLSCLFASA